MGALLSLLIPMIPSLVQGVEAIFTKPGNGQNKMDAIMTALRGILAKMIAVPGTIAPTPTPAVQPTDEALQAMIETVLQQMKLDGRLAPTPAGIPIASPVVMLPAGVNANSLLSGILSLVAKELGPA